MVTTTVHSGTHPLTFEGPHPGALPAAQPKPSASGLPVCLLSLTVRSPLDRHRCCRPLPCLGLLCSGPHSTPGFPQLLPNRPHFLGSYFKYPETSLKINLPKVKLPSCSCDSPQPVREESAVLGLVPTARPPLTPPGTSHRRPYSQEQGCGDTPCHSRQRNGLHGLPRALLPPRALFPAWDALPGCSLLPHPGPSATPRKPGAPLAPQQGPFGLPLFLSQVLECLILGVHGLSLQLISPRTMQSQLFEPRTEPYIF